MTTLGDLLHEVTDAVEPGDRLDAIRAATTGGARRTRSSTWWAAGGVGLVAASAVAALALTTGGAPQVREPDPAAPAPTTATATDDVAGPELRATPVYFVGDTPRGKRLYREFHQLPGVPLVAAVAALARPPADRDYTSFWPPEAIRDVSFDGVGDAGQIGVTVDRDFAPRPVGLTPDQARLAVEQVVRTLQAATQSSAPVQFYVDGNPANQVLGVPTSEPLAAGSDLDVLALVNLSDPFEGQVVDNDEPFVVRGVGNSFEGNIVTRIRRWEGNEVIAEEPAIAGDYADRLFPFEVTFDLTDVPAGDYELVSRTDDPSGEGMIDIDTRRITVVD